MNALTPSSSALPVILLTGFLGSGKTTLLNHLLRDPTLVDTAVVVNEIGDIALDHLLISSTRENIVLLESGCLCCQVTDSLVETLADLYGRRARGECPPFARVVIETTGLANPGPIIRTLMRDGLIRGLFKLTRVVCTVDAVFGAGQLEQHAEARAQASVADQIVITKHDVRGARTGDMLAYLRKLNPASDIMLTDTAIRPASGLLEGEFHFATAAADHVHHDPSVASISALRSSPATWAGIGAWTAALRLRFGDDLLRCKAIIEVAGEASPVVLHGVQTVFDTTRLPTWPDEQRGLRIMCVVRDGDPDWLARSLTLLHVAEGSLPPTSLVELDF